MDKINKKNKLTKVINKQNTSNQDNINHINNNNIFEKITDQPDQIVKKKRGRKKKIVSDIIPVKPDNDTDKNKVNVKKSEINLTNNLENQVVNTVTNIEQLDNKSSSDENNNNNKIRELLTRQLKNVCSTKKLSYNDVKRISKFLSSSIFDKEKCSLWTGYVTNEKNQSKGTYINFYFNKKKIALHRLLYLNYLGDISNDEYIKFSCENKGKCCNINHMVKYSYNKPVEYINEQINDDKDKKEQLNLSDKNNQLNGTSETKLQINTDKKKLIIEF